MDLSNIAQRIYALQTTMEAAFREATRDVVRLAQFLAETKAAAVETQGRIDGLWASLDALEPTAAAAAGSTGCPGCLGCTASLDDAADGYHCDRNGPIGGGATRDGASGPDWGGRTPCSLASAGDDIRDIQNQINWLSALNDIRNDLLFKGSSMLERVAEPPAILLSAPLERPSGAAAGTENGPFGAFGGPLGLPPGRLVAPSSVAGSWSSTGSLGGLSTNAVFTPTGPTETGPIGSGSLGF